MQRYYNSVTDLAGNAIVGATVNVTVGATGAKAALFSDSAGTTPLANPVMTAADGSFAFCAANGRYNITVTKTGLPTQSVNDVLLYDPADISDNSITSRLTTVETNMSTLTNTVNGFTSNINSVEDKVDTLYSTDGARNIWTDKQRTIQAALDILNSASFTPAASVAPTVVGNMVFEITNDTTLKIKVVGSDGVVRSVTLTLA